MPQVKRLIINADDFGYDPQVSRGILEAMLQGVVSSTTLMVNGPHTADAVAQLKGRSLAVGLHLNLARWRPLWGGFPPALLEGGEFVEARAAELPAHVVEAEANAQLGAVEALTGAPATHVDVHKHLHRHANVLEGLIAAAKPRALPVRAIDSKMRERLRGAGVRTPDRFIGDAGAEAYWTRERLQEQLTGLGHGLTELMCHPGYAPSHVKSGYAQQRETELQTFTDPDAKALLGRFQIQLETFRALTA